MVLKRLTLPILDQFYWPLLFGGTVFVCQQFPYRRNDMIHAIWIIPIALCHTFCLGHWPMLALKDLDWVSSEVITICMMWMMVWMVSRSADYFMTCYTVLTRSNKVETAVHGCNSWLSVWTLSCRCPVKLSTQYQPCFIVFLSNYFWLIRSFTVPT